MKHGVGYRIYDGGKILGRFKYTQGEWKYQYPNMGRPLSFLQMITIAMDLKTLNHTGYL